MDRIKKAISAAWEYFSRGAHFILARWKIVLFALVAVFFLTFLLAVYNPDKPLTAEEVAAQWNQNINLLGVEPIYPPQEDFYVGDVWASAVEPCWDERARRSRETGDQACGPSFHNSAIRIGHINITDALNSDTDLPLYSDTPFRQKDDEYRYQTTDPVGAIPVDKKARLSLIAFPEVSISQRRRIRLGSILDVFSFDFINGIYDEEKVSIPYAMTFGISLENANLKLYEYCHSDITKYHCDPLYIRKMMSYAIGDYSRKIRDGKYVYDIQLQFIARVFLSREFDVRHTIVNSSGAEIDSSKPANPSPAANAQPASNPAASASDAAGAVRDSPVPSEGAQAFLSSAAGELTKTVSQRPLVFGYRAITYQLSNAAP